MATDKATLVFKKVNGFSRHARASRRFPELATANQNGIMWTVPALPVEWSELRAQENTRPTMAACRAQSAVLLRTLGGRGGLLAAGGGTGPELSPTRQASGGLGPCHIRTRDEVPEGTAQGIGAAVGTCRGNTGGSAQSVPRGSQSIREAPTPLFALDARCAPIRSSSP